MYKEIEELYKKKSPYNLIKKRIVLIYVLFVLMSFIIKLYSKIPFMIGVIIIMLYFTKKSCEKILNTKLYIYIKPKKGTKGLDTIIKETELDLFRDYSVNNRLYSEKQLLCILNHYRSFLNNKIVEGNILGILSLVLPIVLSFCTKDGFDFNSLANSLPYLGIFSIMIILLYYSFNKLIEINKLLRGTDGMEQRLEIIYSELYIECIEKNDQHKDKRKNNKNRQITKATKRNTIQ